VRRGATRLDSIAPETSSIPQVHEGNLLCVPVKGRGHPDGCPIGTNRTPVPGAPRAPVQCGVYGFLGARVALGLCLGLSEGREALNPVDIDSIPRRGAGGKCLPHARCGRSLRVSIYLYTAQLPGRIRTRVVWFARLQVSVHPPNSLSYYRPARAQQHLSGGLPGGRRLGIGAS
jgi:hypothetical protein